MVDRFRSLLLESYSLVFSGIASLTTMNDHLATIELHFREILHLSKKYPKYSSWFDEVSHNYDRLTDQLLSLNNEVCQSMSSKEILLHDEQVFSTFNRLVTQFNALIETSEKRMVRRIQGDLWTTKEQEKLRWFISLFSTLISSVLPLVQILLSISFVVLLIEQVTPFIRHRSSQ